MRLIISTVAGAEQFKEVLIDKGVCQVASVPLSFLFRYVLFIVKEKGDEYRTLRYVYALLLK